MAEPWEVKVRRWLEEGNENSDMIIDSKLSVRLQNNNPRLMLIRNPKVPFDIGIQIDDNVTSVVLYTSIETATLDNHIRLKIFRDMLIRNDEANFSKFFLAGRNDNIAVRCDLSSKYTQKEELNTALESIINSGRWIMMQLGVKGNAPTEEDIAAFVTEEIKRGTSEAEIEKKLIEEGISKEAVSAILKKAKTKEKKTKETDVYIR
ncbi:MAG: hypothetical protein QXT63_02550 [Thermoplasmata archaeon]